MNWLNIVIIALIVIAVFSIVFYFVQEKLIFKPEKLPPDFVCQDEKQDVEEYNNWSNYFRNAILETPKPEPKDNSITLIPLAVV